MICSHARARYGHYIHGRLDRELYGCASYAYRFQQHPLALLPGFCNLRLYKCHYRLGFVP